MGLIQMWKNRRKKNWRNTESKARNVSSLESRRRFSWVIHLRRLKNLQQPRRRYLHSSVEYLKFFKVEKLLMKSSNSTTTAFIIRSFSILQFCYWHIFLNVISTFHAMHMHNSWCCSRLWCSQLGWREKQNFCSHFIACELWTLQSNSHLNILWIHMIRGSKEKLESAFVRSFLKKCHLSWLHELHNGCHALI